MVLYIVQSNISNLTYPAEIQTDVLQKHAKEGSYTCYL